MALALSNMDNTETENNNVESVSDFVINRSKENFSAEELALHNSGTNCVLKQGRQDKLVDIEEAIQYHSKNEKKTVKKGLAKIILDGATDNRTKKKNKEVATAKTPM